MSIAQQKIVLVFFTALTGSSVLLSVIGGVLNYTPVPMMDMWVSLPFFERLQTGDWRVWWEQHNENRIVLSRVLFWLDISLFKGRGIFLIIVNFFDFQINNIIHIFLGNLYIIFI